MQIFRDGERRLWWLGYLGGLQWGNMGKVILVADGTAWGLDYFGDALFFGGIFAVKEDVAALSQVQKFMNGGGGLVFKSLNGLGMER